MISIRKATVVDISTLQQLNQETFVDNVTYDPDMVMDWALSQKGKDFFTKAVTEPEHHCFVAEDGTTLVGYITVSIKKVDYRKSRCLEIENIGVSPSYQSKGVGSLLMEKAKEWAMEQGYQKLYVSCYFHNTRALSFYRKNGLSEIDIGLEMNL